MALKVGVALAIVLFIFYKKVNIRELLVNLRGMHWGSLLLCGVAYGILFCLSARRWLTLVRVQGIVIPYTRLLRIYFIGLFFNNILLGSMGGDLVKAIFLARAFPSRREGAVVSVAFDRVTGFITFFAIGFIGLLLNWGNPRLHATSALFLLFLLVAVAGLCLLYRRDLLGRIPYLKRMLARLPFEENIRTMYEALYAYRHHGAAVREALLISCALQLGTIVIVLDLARMLGMAGVTYSHLLLLVPVIGTILSIPITPSGWGTGELAFCTLFGALGIAGSRALALDLVMRGLALSWSLIGGVLYALPQRRGNAVLNP